MIGTQIEKNGENDFILIETKRVDLWYLISGGYGSELGGGGGGGRESGRIHHWEQWRDIIVWCMLKLRNLG